MTELIVALNTEESFGLIPKLNVFGGVKLFKINELALLSSQRDRVLDDAKNHNCKLFLDLKRFDTKDTIKDLIILASKLQFELMSIHTDLIEYALSIDRKNLILLEVSKLTDGSGREFSVNKNNFSGIVAPLNYAAAIRDKYKGIIVSPGIRLPNEIKNNHLLAFTPREAREVGVDYIVMGRSITDYNLAKDIVEELK